MILSFVPSALPSPHASWGSTLAVLCCVALGSACDPAPGSTSETGESLTDSGAETTTTPPGDSSAEGSATSGSATSDSGSMTTGATSEGVDTGTDDGPADSGSGDPEPNDCTAEQVIPPAPVECNGVDGVIMTSVIIEDGGDDPSILEGVRRIEGSLRINRLGADNLDFMACLEEVTGDVSIYGNEQLTDVSGLWSLSSIGTDFIFSENPALVDFDGLPNITEVPRHLVIQDNDGLQSISGFHSLTEVGSNLLIQNNDSLLHMDGFGGLEVMNGTFAVTANPQLCISSVNCVGSGILVPEIPPVSWSTQANDESC